jgi:hypothetical protein
VPFPSSHSCAECVEHTVVPDRRVRPRLSRRWRVSRGSPEGHCGCYATWTLVFPAYAGVSKFLFSGHTVSTFLQPFAPPELPGFVATMAAPTPVKRALRLLPGIRSAGCSAAAMSVGMYELPSDLFTGLPLSRRRIFRPFCLLKPEAVLEVRFWFILRALPRSVALTTDQHIRVPASVIWASPSDSWLALTAPRQTEFTCVTDWSISFSCSPPHLAVTQFLSDTGFKTKPRGGLPPPRFVAPRGALSSRSVGWDS